MEILVPLLAPVLARLDTRPFGGTLDRQFAAFLVLTGGLRGGLGETIGDGAGHLKVGLVGTDADRADLVAGDPATAAEDWQDPARIGIAAAPDIEPEPDRILESGAMLFLLRGAMGIDGLGREFLRFGQLGAIGLSQ